MSAPVVLATGRHVPFEQCTGSTPVFAAMRGMKFTSPEELARFVGDHYGYTSITPSHPGMGTDGVGWWVLDAMNAIYRDTTAGRTGPDSRSYLELVDDLDEVSTDLHAHLTGLALEAAGLVVVPVERIP